MRNARARWPAWLLLAAIVPVAAATPPAHREAVLAEVAAAFEEAAVPGGAVVLVEHGQVGVARGFGLADKATKAATTPDTVFRAGSVGKSVVGVGVMMLVEDGLLRLDDKLADLAPEIEIDNPWEATHPVRLVHLLEHTTGWADLSPREFALDDARMSLLDGIRAGGRRTSRYPPGQYHAYSGAGHAIAAYIVGKTTGMPFDRFVRGRIFEPLGMTTAGYRAVPGMAKSYLPDGSETPYQHYPLQPSGGLNLSATDLARFAAFLADDGRAPDGRALLQPGSVRRLERSETTLAARAGLPFGYGLGVAAQVGPVRTLYGHGGAIDSFNAMYRYAPGRRSAYVVMVSGGSLPPRALRALDAFLDDAGKPSPPPATTAAAFAGYAGTYQPIAQRNRLLVLPDSLLTFVRLDIAGDRVVLDGVERRLLPGGLLQSPDRAAPTFVLATTPEGRELLGAVASYRQVSQRSRLGKLAYSAVFALGLLAALVAFATEAVRRRISRAGTAAVLAYLPLLGLLAMMAWATSMPSPLSIVRFGHPGTLSIGVFVLSLLVPVGAVVALFAAFAGGRGGRLVRGIALLAGVVMGVATAYLFAYDWIGLRTWAL